MVRTGLCFLAGAVLTAPVDFSVTNSAAAAAAAAASVGTCAGMSSSSPCSPRPLLSSLALCGSSSYALYG